MTQCVIDRVFVCLTCQLSVEAGPKLPVGPCWTLPSSIPKPDVHAWHSEIEQAQSAMRDMAAVRA